MNKETSFSWIFEFVKKMPKEKKEEKVCFFFKEKRNKNSIILQRTVARVKAALFLKGHN